MPIGPYKDFATCVTAQKNKGHSDNSAKKICGEIEKKTRGEKMKKDWRNLSFMVPIESSLKTTNGDFMIRGIAINNTTTRNGITYTAEELEPSASTLRNKPILADHNNSIFSIVGRTTENVSYDSINKNIPFEAKIVNREVQEMIKNGLITSVSVGAYVKDVEKTEEGMMIARGVDFVELSLVAVPADPNAGFAMAMAESYKMKSSFDEEETEEEDDESFDNVEEKTEMMKCPGCGAMIKMDSKVCEKCGYEMKMKEEKMAEEIKTEKVSEETIVVTAVTESKVQEQLEQKEVELKQVKEELEAKKMEELKAMKEEMAKLKEELAKAKETPVFKGETVTEKKEEEIDLSGYTIEKSNKGFSIASKLSGNYLR